MAHRIISVDSHSPAARAGLKAGDELLRIGGEPVIDFLDYQALTAERRVALSFRRDGEMHNVTVKKDEYEPLGLNFAAPMMSGTRMCCNHCLFCFVDQLPPNVRESMRVKDDDWRMSLMMGNYVTLTNVSDREIDRIIARHASPLYISVHVWDPDERAKLLRQPRAAKLPDQLKRLSDGGIEFHCQAVLCPGLNDGELLDETIRELSKIDGALSLALVPVGLTDHRDGLPELHKYTAEEATRVLDLADRWREKLLKERGTRFVFPSDEFYLQANRPIPSDEAYEDYGQIDDGVGLLRLLETEFTESWLDLPEADRQPTGGTKIAVACGVSAAPFLSKLLKEHPVTGTEIEVYAVENEFFGPSVTVSGLVTGRDLVERMKHVDSDCILITECMLRSEGDKFLDDMPLEEAEALLNRKIHPTGRRGDELLEMLMEMRRA